MRGRVATTGSELWGGRVPGGPLFTGTKERAERPMRSLFEYFTITGEPKMLTV